MIYFLPHENYRSHLKISTIIAINHSSHFSFSLLESQLDFVFAKFWQEKKLLDNIL